MWCTRFHMAKGLGEFSSCVFTSLCCNLTQTPGHLIRQLHVRPSCPWIWTWRTNLCSFGCQETAMWNWPIKYRIQVTFPVDQNQGMSQSCLLSVCRYMLTHLLKERWLWVNCPYLAALVTFKSAPMAVQNVHGQSAPLRRRRPPRFIGLSFLDMKFFQNCCRRQRSGMRNKGESAYLEVCQFFSPFCRHM